MLCVQIHNLNVGSRGTLLPSQMTLGHVWAFLLSKGLKMKDIYNYTFRNWSNIMPNGNSEYIMMKSNKADVKNLIGDFIVTGNNHQVSIVRANSCAIWVSFHKVPSFILDAELVHFVSSFGKVLDERSVQWEVSMEPNCRASKCSTVRGRSKWR